MFNSRKFDLFSIRKNTRDFMKCNYSDAISRIHALGQDKWAVAKMARQMVQEGRAARTDASGPVLIEIKASSETGEVSFTATTEFNASRVFDYKLE